ncbi:hypothetical protein [Gilliamella sp. G0441]|uniref:hypothetical protein n=1 Tax=Gilliamella sp. G0441 TaxID=3384760 RepID=UPI0025DA3285|nr:hypothetical protein [uncultured Gilliamella sp.]
MGHCYRFSGYYNGSVLKEKVIEVYFDEYEMILTFFEQGRNKFLIEKIHSITISCINQVQFSLEIVASTPNLDKKHFLMEVRKSSFFDNEKEQNFLNFRQFIDAFYEQEIETKFKLVRVSCESSSSTKFGRTTRVYKRR